jgi:hypothetical protein
MGHYALLDKDNIVVQVITGRNEDEVVDGISDWEKYYSDFTGLRAVRTSYNTYSGVHQKGGTPHRMNYAAIGGYYDDRLDAFIHPKPYPSWILNETTCTWEPPIPQPVTENGSWWDDENQQWVLIE